MPTLPHTPVHRSEIAVVVVLYRPSAEDLCNIAEWANWDIPIVAVINAAIDEKMGMLPDGSHLTIIRNARNLGLATALNQGLSAAFSAGARYVLMLDQDSHPPIDMIETLAAEAAMIEAQDRALACVAPVLRDRKAPKAEVGAALKESGRRTFATSGTMMTQRAWVDVGPMWEPLFIDGIDHEWCFRARSMGFETVQIPEAVMEHDMGESAINILGRFRPIHRSPLRHYFIVRNTLWLTGRSYLPLRWRLSELLKLSYRVPAYLLYSTSKGQTAKNLAGAFVDGVTKSNIRQPI